MNRYGQMNELSPTRRALLAAGVATLAISLVLSIAPAWAKNSNAGAVKIHDVTSGIDDPGNANDPTVCTFTVVFDYPDPVESGTWTILSWEPTGDGSTVASGTYDTSLTGTDETDPMSFDAGHYRLEYLADGSRSAKHKTFWMGDGCDASGSASDPSASPTDQPSSDPSTSPTEEPSASPTDQPSSDPSTSPTEEPSTSPTDQPSSDPTTSPTEEPSASPTDQPSSDPSTSPTEEPSTSPTDQPSSDPSTSPTEEPSSPPSQDVSPSASPEDGVLGATGSPEPSAMPQADSQSDSGTGTLPDTSTSVPVGLTSLLTALGLLMIVGAHPFIRRSAHADRA